MKKLRGALYGCGMISEFHLRGWNRIPEVEIVALGNRTIERAEERRKQFAPEARVYSDLSTLLKEETLDFIDILTIPGLHKEHCLQAKEAGLHIICQKPITDDPKTAHELVEEMKDYPKLFAIHENHRYRPWFQQVLKAHREGFFGTTHLLHLTQYDPLAPKEAYKLEMEPGVFLEYGSHLVDMIRALLGEPDRVYMRPHHHNPNVKGESMVHVVYEYPQTTAVIDIGWKHLGLPIGSVLIEGDEGEAYYEGTMTRGPSSRFRLLKGIDIVSDETRSPYDDYVESFYLFERECVDAMLNGQPVTQTGAENLKSLLCTFAAYDSAKRREVVRVADTIKALTEGSVSDASKP
jgi:D-apiose dehydrogenase